MVSIITWYGVVRSVCSLGLLGRLLLLVVEDRLVGSRLKQRILSGDGIRDTMLP